MSREKQIEEMTKATMKHCKIDNQCGSCHWSTCNECLSEVLYSARYRKQSEVAREIFEEIYKTMNSVYASVQHSCVGMHGDNPETMRLLGKLEGIKHLGDEIAELKKKYTEDGK